MIYIFDVDDTLYAQMALLTKALDKEFGENFDFGFDVKEFYAICRQYGEDVFPQVVAGEMSVDECGVYRIRKAFEYYGKSFDTDCYQRIHETYTYNQQHIDIESDKKIVLEYLKNAGEHIAILTNGPTDHQRNKVNQLGLEKYAKKSEIFISGEVGVSKPDSKIFKHIEQVLHAKPEELVYIGDSLANDVMGAKKAGWNMVWINRRGVTLEDSFPYQPDYIVHQDDSLLEVIKCLKKDC